MNYIDTHKLLYRYPDMEKKASQDKNQIKDTNMNYIDVQTLRRNAEMHMYKKADLSDYKGLVTDRLKAVGHAINPMTMGGYLGQSYKNLFSDLKNRKWKDAFLGRQNGGFAQYLIDKGKLSKDTMLRYDPILNSARGANASIAQDYGANTFKNRVRSQFGIRPVAQKEAPTTMDAKLQAWQNGIDSKLSDYCKRLDSFLAQSGYGQKLDNALDRTGQAIDRITAPK